VNNAFRKNRIVSKWFHFESAVLRMPEPVLYWRRNWL